MITIITFERTQYATAAEQFIAACKMLKLAGYKVTTTELSPTAWVNRINGLNRNYSENIAIRFDTESKKVLGYSGGYKEGMSDVYLELSSPKKILIGGLEAKIDQHEKTVKVGCKTVTFAEIKALSEAIVGD